MPCYSTRRSPSLLLTLGLLHHTRFISTDYTWGEYSYNSNWRKITFIWLSDYLVLKQQQTDTHTDTDSERHNYTMNAFYLAHKSGIASQKHYSLMFHHVFSQPSGIQHEAWHETLGTFNLPLWRITQPKLYKDNEICSPFHFPSHSYPVILPACDNPMSTLVARPWIIETHYVAPVNLISLI